MPSVRRQAAAGAVWNFSAGVGVRALGLVGTLVLTRFISPADYGEVSVAAICVITVTRLFQFGLGQYVIARRAGPGEAFQAHVFHVAAVGVACFGLFLLREPLGIALASPGMTRFVPGLAIAAVLTSVSFIPSATLIRSLTFRVVALSRAAGEVSFTVVSVALAPLLGASAIVAGNVARAVVTSSMLISGSSKAEWMRPVAVRPRTLRNALAFGLPLSLGSLADMVATHGDNLLVSRLFGPRAMGQYNLAYNLASTPTGQMADNVGDILLPSFAKMDIEQRRRALPRAAALMALVLFPVAAGLAAVSATAVATLLDRRWADLAPMLTILSAVALPYPVIWSTGAVLTAEGHTRPLMFLGFLKATLVVGLIVVMGRTSPLWACGAVALAFSLQGAAYVVTGRRLLGIRIVPLVLATVGPLLASCGMLIAVIAMRAVAVGAGLGPGVPRLAFEVAVGVITYAGAACVLFRPALVELLDLTRGVFRGRAARWSERPPAAHDTRP